MPVPRSRWLLPVADRAGSPEVIQDWGDGSYLPVSIRDFGAKIDGVTDDANAWDQAVAVAAATGSPIVHPGGVSCVSRTITYPAAARLKIWGTGTASATIKGINGLATVLQAVHSHLVAEWYCELRGITVDGGAGPGPAVDLQRTTKFIAQDLQITNCVGTGWKVTSSFDGRFTGVFVSAMNGPVGSGAPAVIWTTTPTEDMDHNTFIDLHIEPGAVAGSPPLLQSIGGGGGKTIRKSFVYGLKLHGDNTNGFPTNTPLALLDANTQDNVFFGVLCTACSGAPQIQCQGSRNEFYYPCSSAPGSASNPTALIQIEGNDNVVIAPSPGNANSGNFTTALVNVLAGARNKIVEPLVAGLTNPIANQGASTLMTDRHGSSADRGDASISLTPGVDFATQVFRTALTANRTVTVPNAASLKNWSGARFRIARSGLGAFTLTIQDSTPTVIKVLPAATADWVDIEFNDGSGWTETAFGGL